ncbi:MAG: hypothetical protein QXN11_03260 [Thermoplasmata archaeon]
MKVIFALFSIFVLISLPFSIGYNGNYDFISFSNDEYGNIFNVSCFGNNIIKEIKFNNENKSEWKIIPNGFVFINSQFKIEINNGGIINIRDKNINYTIEFYENIDIQKAITFNGVIANDGNLIINFLGNFELEENEITTNSSSTFFFNTTIFAPVLHNLSGPDLGGIIMINGNYTMQNIYVNSTENFNELKFSFNFNSGEKYFLFYFYNLTKNYQIYLNGKNYSNYKILKIDNYTVYSIYLPPGNDTLEFIQVQNQDLQSFLAISIILLAIIIGFIMIYEVRKK